MTDPEDNLISTGIDRLMQYMQSEEEAQVDEVADFLGVDTDTVIRWAKALEDSGLVEVSYTATRGRIIKLEGAEEGADDQIEEAKEDASQKIEAARMEADRRRIQQFETVLEQLEEMLEEDEKDAEELRGEVNQANLRKIEAYIRDIEATEEDVEALLEDFKEVLTDIGVIETLRKHRLEAAETRTVRETMLAVDAEKEYGCEECGAAFYTRLGLRVHGELFGHGESVYTCADCGKAFDTEKGLHIHEGMKGHGLGEGMFGRIRSMLPGGGTGSFKCAECQTTFADVDELKAHQHGTGHRVRPLRCDRCGHAFETPGGLHAHEEMIHHD